MAKSKNDRILRDRNAKQSGPTHGPNGVTKSDVRNSTRKQSRKGEAAEMWSKWSANTQSAGDYFRLERKMELAAESQTLAAAKAANAERDEWKLRDEQDLVEIRKHIASDTSLTPFRKHVLTLLCQVPRGQFTTYKALSDAVPLTAAAHQSSHARPAGSAGCARAVGLVMRTNPFAPVAPCHRVLTADGKIGGYKGSSGDEGKFVQEKRRLLVEEGVKFDANGKVLGEPFTEFV